MSVAQLVWQQVINIVHHFTSGGDEHVEKGYGDAGILKTGPGVSLRRRRCGPRRRGRTSRRSATSSLRRRASSKKGLSARAVRRPRMVASEAAQVASLPCRRSSRLAVLFWFGFYTARDFVANAPPGPHPSGQACDSRFGGGFCDFFCCHREAVPRGARLSRALIVTVKRAAVLRASERVKPPWKTGTTW